MCFLIYESIIFAPAQLKFRVEFQEASSNLNVKHTVENIEAQKLINRIQKEIITAGIDPAKLVKELKKLRAYALEEGNPTLVKVLRLTYEHIGTFETFSIPIPDEEPVDEIDGNEVKQQKPDTPGKNDPVESLNYLLSVMSNSSNKANLNELKEYRNFLLEFAQNH